jgi:hypothetical protein
MAGSGGYYGIADSADGFGAMLAQGFFIATGIIGLVAGMTCGVFVGGLTEKLLRYLGVMAAYALCVATVVNALFIWQLIGMVQTKYPGFRPPVNNKSNAATKPEETSTNMLRSDNPCAQSPPPPSTKERSLWDTECR